jgi:hypothetical protein
MSRISRPSRVPNRRSPLVAVELLGVGVAACHHRGLLGDALVGLAQLHPVFARQAVQSLDRGVQQLGIGREADGLGLHRGIDGDSLEVLGPQRATLMRYAQALGQLRRRSAIEAVIGHMKTDGHLSRCRLKGRGGDVANAILTAVGHNLRLILAWLRELLLLILAALVNVHQRQPAFKSAS